MTLNRSIASLILELRGRKVVIDADLADIYGVTTKVLNQAVRRNRKRFPGGFAFRLTPREKTEVVTNCDHLARLKYSPMLPRAYTEHGAIMAATVLNSTRAVAMSVYVVRAFIRMREQLAANAAILKRLDEIDRTLLRHDASLRDIYHKLLPLLRIPPELPRRRIGFISDDRCRGRRSRQNRQPPRASRCRGCTGIMNRPSIMDLAS